MGCCASKYPIDRIGGGTEILALKKISATPPETTTAIGHDQEQLQHPAHDQELGEDGSGTGAVKTSGGHDWHPLDARHSRGAASADIRVREKQRVSELFLGLYWCTPSAASGSSAASAKNLRQVRDAPTSTSGQRENDEENNYGNGLLANRGQLRLKLSSRDTPADSYEYEESFFVFGSAPPSDRAMYKYKHLFAGQDAFLEKMKPNSNWKLSLEYCGTVEIQRLSLQIKYESLKTTKGSTQSWSPLVAPESSDDDVEYKEVVM
mmetsp:Transcript_18853/g.47126  ORF Transcript_18853/g.47126 Transcript_18853/m.47126 type:complete len:264 (+) Transcript_18853:49-840(+)|eukprot:g18844.t1